MGQVRCRRVLAAGGRVAAGLRAGAGGHAASRHARPAAAQVTLSEPVVTYTDTYSMLTYCDLLLLRLFYADFGAAFPALAEHDLVLRGQQGGHTV